MFGEPGSRLDPSSSAPGSSSASGASSAPGSSGPKTVPETQSSQRVSRSPSSSAPHVPLPMAPPTVPPPVPPPMASPMPALHATSELEKDADLRQKDVQKNHWSMGVTERVRKQFYAKAKVRLLDTVSNWKGDWIVKGYECGKPLSSPRMCGMASFVIGGILSPSESPSLAL
uniref:Uncharacterized protein n=1 Tax=Brassica oleracea var. oleracea TaxID=109376 RepID=A0A0D3ED83_BRAOL